MKIDIFEPDYFINNTSPFEPSNDIFINHCDNCAQKKKEGFQKYERECDIFINYCYCDICEQKVKEYFQKYIGEYIYFYISNIKDRKSTKYQRKKGIFTQGREYLVTIKGTRMFINAPYTVFYKNILIQTHIKKGDFLYKVCIQATRFYNFLYKNFQKLYIQKLKVSYIIKLYYKTHLERKVYNFRYSIKLKKDTYIAILLRKLKLKTNRCIQCKKYYL